jgi:hypothetical protein
VFSRSPLLVVLLTLALLWPACLLAQENYEIQVYGSETVPPKTTMVELHSNFTIQGSTMVEDGVIPTEHAMHETLEITQGITPWFETGFYVFTSITGSNGWEWVGDHIRPRVRVPESWHWPVGVSLSAEFGYQRRSYSTTTWDFELRPIVDKQKGRLYWSVNPAFDKGFTGPPHDQQWAFEPAAKVSWDFTKHITGGVEYYGAFGPVANIDPFHDQGQAIYPVIDLNISPLWEINFGPGIGFTAGTDHLLFKTIIGRRLSWGKAGGRKHSPKSSD